ncbi:MAG: ATP F0F1 synthase subunit B' [Cereibacter sphaeroides]|uniref:ATP synthase subunit b n=1 Tax=Cereibacter sphaeroides TaxID=1063 RepID=A0A2W5U0G7_CERSP|nr:MAG: ATP F0F1 synthase subunit B' [Cereibacter sphaeroides]
MATEVTEAASQAAPAVGMPQLNFETWPNQIFWLLVTLVAIYLLLTKIALPRIGSVLADRSGAISNDLAAAEELKQKALKAEQAYNEALAQARADANRIVAEARAAIQKDLDAATATADARIAKELAASEVRINEIRDGAMEAVTEVAKDTAKEIVASLGGKADARSVTAAVTARLKGMAQ